MSIYLELLRGSGGKPALALVARTATEQLAVLLQTSCAAGKYQQPKNACASLAEAPWTRSELQSTQRNRGRQLAAAGRR